MDVDSVIVNGRKYKNEGKGYGLSLVETDPKSLVRDWEKRKDDYCKPTPRGVALYEEFKAAEEKAKELDDKFPAVLCDKCQHAAFSIRYGEYECIGVCTECGNRVLLWR